MKAVVADASAIVEYLLRTTLAASIGRVVEDPDVDLHAPALCDIEVAAALRRVLLGGRMTVERAEEAVADYLDLPLTRHGHEALMAPALRLRENFTAYDATYLALAERLGASLLSADGRLARAVDRHTGIDREI